MAGPAWLRRRDPGLIKLRRAVRVAAVACIGFYGCRYGLGNPQLAVYSLFAAFALGALSQLPGPRRRTVTTLLASLPVAAGLVTVGSLVAVTLALSTSAMLVFGFLIAFAGVGGPRLVGVAGGMQLMFILPAFPPYGLGMLPTRIAGVALGIGLLILAELVVWPEPPAERSEDRVADACQALAGLLTGESGVPRPDQPAAAKRASDRIRTQNLPPLSRPASAGRRDSGLSHAIELLRYALARLGQILTDRPPPPPAARLLTCAGETATAAAAALRGGPLPRTAPLATLFAEVRDDQRRAPTRAPADVRATNRALVIGDAVWAIATAVRVARGGKVDDDHDSGQVNRRRFPYAYAGPVRRYWRQFAMHLTPRSVYFQQAIRVAVALAAGRLLAGVLNLQHGFWVLLATLTLLRSRAVDTRIALRPAAIGTVTGALAAAGLLFVVGNQQDVYAALLPPVLVLAVAAGSVVGLGWGQAMFTVAITLVFSQVAAPKVGLAEVRVDDVLLGAAIGMAAGLLAWPRGAGGELRRATARLLSSGGDLVRQTAGLLTAEPPAAPPRQAPAEPGASDRQPPGETGASDRQPPGEAGASDRQPPGEAGASDRQPSGEAGASDRQPSGEPGPPDRQPPAGPGGPAPPVLAVEDPGTVDRAQGAMQLADASYSMYQAERHNPAESTVDWDAIFVAGQQIVRGSELLRAGNSPGQLEPWRDLVESSANRVADACGQLADALNRRQELHAAPVELFDTTDSRLFEIQDWLANIHDDLTRVGGARE
jgi:uncharacterized membrane protein YccC